MYQNFPQQYPEKFLGIIILLSLWELYWKGRALWKSAQRNDKWWFIAILVTNTLGFLSIAYIFFFSRKTDKKN